MSCDSHMHGLTVGGLCCHHSRPVALDSGKVVTWSSVPTDPPGYLPYCVGKWRCVGESGGVVSGGERGGVVSGGV